MYLFIERIHIKMRGRQKKFQSKELFGAEEFNLAIAILNSEEWIRSMTKYMTFEHFTPSARTLIVA